LEQPIPEETLKWAIDGKQLVGRACITFLEADSPALAYTVPLVVLPQADDRFVGARDGLFEYELLRIYIKTHICRAYREDALDLPSVPGYTATLICVVGLGYMSQVRL
jgi:hypothetical protein